MKNQFTKGPWRIATSVIGNNLLIKSCEAAPRSIATMHDMFPHLLTQEERAANARLIAKAPELFQALNDLLESFTAYVDTDKVVNADIVEPVTNARNLIQQIKGDV